MSENEQELRDEQDRRGYADVRPKEKQYREPLIKSLSTPTIQEPIPRHPVRLPPSQQIDIDKGSIDNVSKKKNPEKQTQIKHHHPIRYQSDSINENQSYPQPQPNLSSSSAGYVPQNISQAYPSTAKSSTNYGPMYVPPSSLAPPAAPVQPYVQPQVPYPPQQPSYSASDEPKPDPKQYNAYDLNIILDRLSRMESKLDKISDLEAEVKELKRENEIMAKMQASRSEMDFPPILTRRPSLGRFPQDRHHYNKSADHHISNSRYVTSDYMDDPHYIPRHDFYPYYERSPFYKKHTPPTEDKIPSRRRIRSQSFGNNQDHDYPPYHQYYSNYPSSRGYHS